MEKDSQQNPNRSLHFSRRRLLIMSTAIVAGGAILIENQKNQSPSPTPDPRNNSFIPEPSARPDPTTIFESPSPRSSTEPIPEPTEKIKGLIYPGEVFYSVRNAKNRFFLTIDDCNDEEIVKRWLDLAQEFNVLFTFFPAGASLNSHPDIFKRALDEGHELGLHSYSHPDLAFLSEKHVRSQIAKNLDVFRRKVSKDEEVKLLRLPFGSGTIGKEVDPEIKTVAEEFNLAIAGWNNSSVDTDLSDDPRKKSTRIILRNLRDLDEGDILLFHANFPNSPAAGRKVLERAEERGLTSDSLSANLALAPEVGAPPKIEIPGFVFT